MNRRFCAVESAAVGDPLAGTATHAERNLLLAWPRAKWCRSLRQASDMPETVVERLTALAESGRRVNLIHRHDRPTHRHRIYLMPENRGYEVEREALPDFLDAFGRGESLAAWEVAPPSGPLLLCCTHGKKDKCCAKFGFAAYKALASTAARHELPIEIWESSHLGGCRLAASAMVFPALRKYGRIGEEDVLPLLEAEVGGRPYLPCYRGDARLTPVQQCAQIAALGWLAAHGHDASLRLLDDDGDGRTRRLRFGWREGELSGRLVVHCRSDTLVRLDTCADLEAAGATPSEVWRAIDITADAAPDRRP
ncbi:sucrase ferredoxin [Halomonas koreensis]|uniref:Sucrase ferredoxin n=1 Tax=Halomonas koreensis TaxID=245385 RepID=A0ABU1G4M9_9GAMM|nr:sucrase ferredoxin [Halomonas koreensis]MDR5867379.1 sucrase ferredoxin [Halomonas koreensis]